MKDDGPMTAETAAENAVILRATEMTPGSIASNAETVLAAVRAKTASYKDVSKYEGDEKGAKADRALLRKQKDAAKTMMASIQEAWNRPLEEFLSLCGQILREFDLAIDTIDAWVKEGEAREKEKKRGAIRAYFDSKGFDLVPLDRLFNSKWLNRTHDMRDVKKEIDGAIADIHDGIKILENISDHGMAAKAFYLETLDLGAAMARVNALKSNAEKLAREQAGREERELRARVAANALEEGREEAGAAREERATSLAEEALGIEPDTAPPARPEMLEFTLRFRVTREQRTALKKYMTDNGIAYEQL